MQYELEQLSFAGLMHWLENTVDPSKGVIVGVGSVWRLFLGPLQYWSTSWRGCLAQAVYRCRLPWKWPDFGLVESSHFIIKNFKFGFALVFACGILTNHCMLQLVHCSQHLSKKWVFLSGKQQLLKPKGTDLFRKGDTHLDYGGVAYEAFANSFSWLKKHRRKAQ